VENLPPQFRRKGIILKHAGLAGHAAALLSAPTVIGEADDVDLENVAKVHRYPHGLRD
jgi:hypothetical protein